MADLRSLIPAHREIADRIRAMFPEESEENLADTIEGESSLPGAIMIALRAAIEREANGKALGEIIETMVGRKRRLDEGARNIRLAALNAMSEGGLKKLAAPDLSVSVSYTKPKILLLDNGDSVPDEFCKIVRTPSKTDIAKAIAEGREVPGVTLSNPEPYLTVRRQ
jgi:hypothetical protein